jgi:hypothetical protein
LPLCSAAREWVRCSNQLLWSEIEDLRRYA